MDWGTILLNSFFASISAGGLAILFTIPPRYLAAAYVCGFSGRFAHDALMSAGMTANWSTVAAAGAVVVAAAIFTRRNVVPPVVLVSGVLPLGAAASMFHALIGLMRVSSLQGAALDEASVALTADIAKVFTTSLAIAIGLGVGMAVVRLVRGEQIWERV